ncbi:glycosyltransferase family 39 protein [Streptomyces sp. NBC_01142]|uniref:mannosyltransferase family protein n=1 Tax=Streptomyces sp. NBC_01142 TaxID=2975865 RepID=UPI0022569A87|nr:glycosyltransferase family 39 protein [Streptomyces sp. NBC_01142]MCX4824523.1 glycosyltransferase family 39 protein [Streptomyces sp. NBC_01142]
MSAAAPDTAPRRPLPPQHVPSAGRGDGAAARPHKPHRHSPRRPARSWPARLAARLSPTDRLVLQLYLLTRIGLWITAYCTGLLFPDRRDAKEPGPMLSRWEQWDWHHFQHIAQYGYFNDAESTPQHPDNRAAFFPGFPLLLRAVHLVTPGWTVAGLLISLVAGAVAMLALARIAHLTAGTAAGQRAVLLVLVSPCAVFLAAGYTESLFLALALPAWLGAKRGRWALAAILTACATTTRVSGLFLAAAVAVEFLLARDGRRTWRSLPWLALPALPALVYTWYLHGLTGDWMAWKHAQERGWHREFHPPWEAWSHTWNAGFDGRYTTGYALMFQAELVAVVIGVLLLGVLLRHRRWPEAAYIALNLWALGTSYWYMSIPRATLLWWPLWTALAVWSLRNTWVKNTYLCVAAPLTTVFAIAFTSGRWAG